MLLVIKGRRIGRAKEGGQTRCVVVVVNVIVAIILERLVLMWLHKIVLFKVWLRRLSMWLCALHCAQ